MARIPQGNFGNMVAQGTPAARLNPGAFITGNGAEQLGNTLMRVGGAGIAEERQQQAQADADRERLIQEALKKEQETQKELKTLKLADKLKTRQDEITSVTDYLTNQVNSGQLNYSDLNSAFEKSLQKLPQVDLNGYDEVDNQRFSNGINDYIRNAQLKLGGVAQKAATDDYRSQVDIHIDRIGKAAGLPDTDMKQVTADLNALDSYGEKAYGAGWAKKKQDITDNAWDANLNQQSMLARNDITKLRQLKKDITSGQYADKLDSNRRNTLIGKLDGFETSIITRNEAAAARADREQTRRLNDGLAAAQDFKMTVDEGHVPSPEYYNEALQRSNGTPSQKLIINMMEDAKINGGLGAQPISVLNQKLTEVNKSLSLNGSDPKALKDRDRLVKLISAKKTDYQNNGIQAATTRGVVPALVPLDMTTIDTIAGSLKERLKQADVVSIDAQKIVSPFTNEEAGNLYTSLSVLPENDRAKAVKAITTAIGNKYIGAVSAQLNKSDDALALALRTSTSKSNGVENAKLIFSGQRALKDGTAVKDPAKLSGTNAAIAERLNGVFRDSGATESAKKAAQYIAAGIAEKKGGVISNGDITEAINRAIDGQIIEHNNQKIPIPSGLTEQRFSEQLKSYSIDDVNKQANDGMVRIGGVLIKNSDFIKSLPGQELAYIGNGRYTVISQGRAVTNTQGTPVVIKVQ